mmetsp:Transcript_8649/g.38458  ORF Transcript_8649/g.38458 Transcript_8649/m.38458 type:complete len:259 (-) Transcript_8649:3640-4416(-)|eukprot:CAMPEP_0113953912 /NCGR_PEP_ID=MMETSP0011_2-20120614/120_1 /TAXON_ID=101924 /ORGANISM="Rhodosorus marinus" /LENGTH=258 /DNA_ID=CAMNT_0000962701 /DNA_START=80 /DNA_END=856 /DNA_ORIENTATION=- /assembly_acc=CAM_ASM_000156
MGKGECKPTGALENERELKCGKVGEPQVKPIIPGEEKGVSGVDEETSMPEHNGAEDSLGESMTPVSGGSVTASCDEKEPEHEYDLTEEPLFESVKALLMCWTAANGMDSYDWDHLSIFYAREVSEMPLDDYLDRIFKYSTKSIGCAVAAVIYLRRAAKINPNLCMNAFNAHRLIMMALTAAVKFSEHVVCLNSFYAEVGGLCLEEFNALELEFLLAVDFQLIVSEKEYLECKRMLDGMITPPKVVDVLTNELPLCVVG